MAHALEGCSNSEGQQQTQQEYRQTVDQQLGLKDLLDYAKVTIKRLQEQGLWMDDVSIMSDRSDDLDLPFDRATAVAAPDAAETAESSEATAPSDSASAAPGVAPTLGCHREAAAASVTPGGVAVVKPSQREELTQYAPAEDLQDHRPSSTINGWANDCRNWSSGGCRRGVACYFKHAGFQTHLCTGARLLRCVACKEFDHTTSASACPGGGRDPDRELHLQRYRDRRGKAAGMSKGKGTDKRKAVARANATAKSEQPHPSGIHEAAAELGHLCGLALEASPSSLATHSRSAGAAAADPHPCRRLEPGPQG